jgi:hypothetical protein
MSTPIANLSKPPDPMAKGVHHNDLQLFAPNAHPIRHQPIDNLSKAPRASNPRHTYLHAKETPPMLHTLKHTLSLTRTTLLLGFVVVLLLGLVTACGGPTRPPIVTTVTIPFYWTAPVIGSPVDTYHVYRNVDSAGWTLIGITSHLTYPVPCVIGGVTNLVRVAGVDSLGRIGSMSLSSDPVVR